MRHNVIVMQWVVIGVLLVGGTASTVMLVTRADKYRSEAAKAAGNTASYLEQIRQAKEAPKTIGAPLPEAVANGPASPTPVAAKASKNR